MLNPPASKQPSDDRGPILASVIEPLRLRGFNPSQLKPDIPTTQNGPYQFETYFVGSANLALLSLPPHVATEANLFRGPHDASRADFSFVVNPLAGDGELLIVKPNSFTHESFPLYRGGPVWHVRPGDVYACRAGESGLIVADYCDPTFQPEWEKPLREGSSEHEGLKLPRSFWLHLNSRPNGSGYGKRDDCTYDQTADGQ
jgi:hypothetical protein